MAGALEVAMNLLKNLDSIERAFPLDHFLPYIHTFEYTQEQIYASARCKSWPRLRRSGRDKSESAG
jgi:hypothetical protein